MLLGGRAVVLHPHGSSCDLGLQPAAWASSYASFPVKLSADFPLTDLNFLSPWYNSEVGEFVWFTEGQGDWSFTRLLLAAHSNAALTTDRVLKITNLLTH